MTNVKASRLRTYLNQTDNIENQRGVEQWSKRVATFLEGVFGEEAANRFKSLLANDPFDELALKQGYIEGVLANLDDSDTPMPTEFSTNEPSRRIAGSQSAAITRDVFVVHGHDGAAKESVARFLEKLGLVPIILHEQANEGRTLIEKFETWSNGVSFAVVLLTPDDKGGPAAIVQELHPRARQNVILELGYFAGRLGRTRVCALYKGGVELPSDLQGLVYIELDTAGAWKPQLAQELIAAKLNIRLEGLVGK